MKPLYKQGKLGLFLFITLTVFGLSLANTIINPNIGTILTSISLLGTSTAIFLTIVYKNKKNNMDNN
jgi:hypothetical protein